MARARVIVEPNEAPPCWDQRDAMPKAAVGRKLLGKEPSKPSFYPVRLIDALAPGRQRQRIHETVAVSVSETPLNQVFWLAMRFRASVKISMSPNGVWCGLSKGMCHLQRSNDRNRLGRWRATPKSRDGEEGWLRQEEETRAVGYGIQAKLLRLGMKK